MNELEQLNEEVSTGYDFKTWESSRVGKYIIARAERYEIETLRELARVDPSSTVEIMRLQTEARVPKLLINWIREAIAQGEQSRFALMEIEE